MTDRWSESRGQRPYTVWIGERAGKGSTLWLRWYVDGQPVYQRTEVGTVRDGRGRILKRSVQRAQKEADAKIAELRGERPAQTHEGPLTYRDGLALAFSPRGPYPLDPSEDEYTRQTKAYAEDAARYMGGEGLTWDAITPGIIRSIWRKVHTEAGEGQGYGRAEKIVTAVYAIARWLEGEFPDQRFPRPIPRWRGELRDYWKKKGHEIKPYRPRHTPEEMEKLYRNRHRTDPRLALGLMLGGPLRGGQVRRTMRSDCDLSGEVWRVQIPFVSRRKKAPKIALSPSERAALEEAITTGYLSDLEAAFCAGEIEDYALFPGGKLRKGKAVVERTSPQDRSAFGRMLHDLERASEVEPVEGRAWYGLRRLFSDLFETAVDDDRVKDEGGGWRYGSEMRRTIYQNQEAEEIAEQAASARERLRPPEKTEDSTSET